MSTWFEDLEKIRFGKYFHLIAAFLAIIASGFLMFYHFKPVFFQDCNIIKLMILSSAITLPFVVFNNVVALIFLHFYSKYNKNFTYTSEGEDNMTLFITIAIIYYSIYVSYNEAMTFSACMKGIISREVYLAIWLFLICIFTKFEHTLKPVFIAPSFVSLVLVLLPIITILCIRLIDTRFKTNCAFLQKPISIFLTVSFISPPFALIWSMLSPRRNIKSFLWYFFTIVTLCLLFYVSKDFTLQQMQCFCDWGKPVQLK